MKKLQTLVLAVILLISISCQKEEQEECYTLDGTYYDEYDKRINYYFNNKDRVMLCYIKVENTIVSYLLEGSYELNCKSIQLPKKYLLELQVLENKIDYNAILSDSIGKKTKFVLIKTK